MADINHVILVGRLVKDAELKYTTSGQAVCSFSIAINRRKRNGDQWENEANYFDVILWGRQGESLYQYLLKGKLFGVEGELRQNRWEHNGQTRSKVEIMATNIQFLSSGQQSEGTEKSSPENRGASSNQAGGDNFTDDIPF